MKLMMLAAGEGTRLRPHTLTLPKPAIPFLGVPLAYHSLSLFMEHGPLDLVVNTFHLPEHIVRTYRAIEDKLGSLSFSHESGTILGSGGGLKKAQSLIGDGEAFWLLNADEVILPRDPHFIEQALKLHTENKALATLFVMKHPEVGTKFGGVWSEGSKVKGFGKTPMTAASEPWHFIGMQILSPRVFDYLPAEGESNILYDGLVQGISKGETVQIFPLDCLWFETGNPSDFLSATSACLNLLADEKASVEKSVLQKTLTHFTKPGWSIQKADSILLLKMAESTVHSDVGLDGAVVVGESARIEKGAFLKNAIVGNQQVILAGERVIDTLVI